MAKIAIIGAGRIGTATAKILLLTSDHSIVLIDQNRKALEKAFSECENLCRTPHQIMLMPEIDLKLFVAETEKEHRSTLHSVSPDIVICATPFTKNASIAKIAIDLGIHYIDFTEDIKTAKDLNIPENFEKCIVPQTGLAPGLVSYVGLSLFDELEEPHSLMLRVGALPAVSFAPHFYAETWSINGLINEYMKNGEAKTNGGVHSVISLVDYETININGIVYECFNTSGGLGNIDAYKNIDNVNYKSLRYIGHHRWLKEFLNDNQNDFDKCVIKAQNIFSKTRDDRVILIAHAVDKQNNSSSTALHFYPNLEIGLTGLELTTAGTGVAIAELILADMLSPGLVTATNVPFDKLMQTAAMQLVFDGCD